MSLPETEIDDLPKEIKALPEEMKAQYRSWAGYVLPDGRKFQDVIKVEFLHTQKGKIPRFCLKNVGAALQNADLSGANLQGLNLKKARLKGVNFKGANLREARLDRAHLSGADLSGADLSGADLTDVKGLLHGWKDSGNFFHHNKNVILSPTTILPLEVLKLHYQADCHQYVCANNDDYSNFFLFCSMVLEDALIKKRIFC